ncbi:MAG: hypothetical protein IJU86_04620 [Firmicutes bacterium]|nr:hypothetical protein [Bacillota bacterium]
MEDKNFSDDENDILNRSYEDIYSINENKNAIEKLDLGASIAYQRCGQQSRIRVALDKNGNKIGIARSPKNSEDESITRNCLNYAFLASCGERVPHILCKFKDNDDSSSRDISEFEVQKFFPHDAMHNYFQLDAFDITFMLDAISEKTNIKSFEDVAQLKDKNVKIKSDDCCTYTYFEPYLLVYHILTECDQEFKTQFIDHFATLFADRLCFRILDRNCANVLVVPSKDGHKKDIVNIDVDFGLQTKVTKIAYSTYLALYLVVKELTFSFDESYTNDELSKVNNFLNQKYKANGDKVNFEFRPKQELKISPEIIAEIDKKIIEKIEQRLNFRKDKFVQYYIDNCIRRGDIDKQVAF